MIFQIHIVFYLSSKNRERSFLLIEVLLIDCSCRWTKNYLSRPMFFMVSISIILIINGHAVGTSVKRDFWRFRMARLKWVFRSCGQSFREARTCRVLSNARDSWHCRSNTLIFCKVYSLLIHVSILMWSSERFRRRSHVHSLLTSHSASRTRRNSI